MLSEQQTLRLIRERLTHPASLRELVQTLRIPREERAGFKRMVRNLVTDGSLVKVRGHRYGVPDRMNLVVGRIQMKPGGFGFVAPEHAVEETAAGIYIAREDVGDAMHGDRVVVRVEHRADGGGAQGRVVRIIERNTTSLVGRYDVDQFGIGFVVPFDRRLTADVQIPNGEIGGARPGEMVVAEITRWPTATRNAAGRVTEVLGDADRPGVDTKIIIRKYGICDGHSDAAAEQARRLGTDVRERDVRGRTDFRKHVVVTIDGEHARDFDDAVGVERLPNGNFWLAVHIADVSHYVTEGSVLDAEACERATSVYFPERAVHMFPEELATGLCSLRPHVDRLVQSCLMEVDRHGEVVRHEIHDGVIHSCARMTYTDVNAILTDRDEATIEQYRVLVPHFDVMLELFLILNARRRRRGSIDFDLPEPEVVLDAEGLIESIIPAERNVAHRLIEEFMLLANETVARHLSDREIPALYRVHEPPDALKVEQFEQFVTGLGYSLAAPPRTVSPRHFQKLVHRIHGTPEEKPIAYLMLKTMQKARYDSANLGHFGLAVSSYAHFTSPIRRYPDLVVHRMLREARMGRMTEQRRVELAEQILPEAARHSSDRERRANDAERELMQWKKVRFMADKVGDEFEGYITGVAAFGLFVELVEHFVEGLVHISSMADDYYRFVERAHVLRGENTRKVYRLGDRVKVQVVRVDMERRQIELGLVAILDAVRTAESGRRRHRSSAPARRGRDGRRPRSR